MVHSLDDDLVPPPFRPPHDVLIPVVHPPDALIVARETETRWEKQLHAAGARTSPVINWALLGLMLAVF